MNKQDFMRELNDKLHKLPEEEKNNALKYYEEYFEEAGDDKELNILEELGSPANIASQIIADFAIKETESDEKKSKGRISTIWIVILAIFASPIALPIAIAIVSVIFALVITILALLFAFGITAFALCISGILCFIMSFGLITTDIPTMFFFIGYGMFSVGLGISFWLLAVLIYKKAFTYITRKLSKLILRRKENDEK